MKKKKFRVSPLQIFRFITQLIFFIFLPGFYSNVFIGIKILYKEIISGNFSFYNDFPVLISALSVIPLTIILGRFFCGWICAFGSMGDWLFAISCKTFKIKKRINPSVDYYLKYIKYMILILFFVFVWNLDLSFLDTANPWSVFGILANVTTLPDFSTVIGEFLIGAILLLAIIVASMFIERFFCRYLCPLGALFTLLSRFSITKIKKTKQGCGSCKLCTYKCSMGINLDKYDIVKSGECIHCYKCVTSCPKNHAFPSVLKKNVGNSFPSTVAILSITIIFLIFSYLNNTFINASTYSSNFLSTQNGEGQYIDGIYEGTGSGFRGSITVDVTVEGGFITAVHILSHDDDAQYFTAATNSVIDEILVKQSTNVDAVSGATFSSLGIMEAVFDALKNAKAETLDNETSDTDTSLDNNTTSNTTTTTTNTTTTNQTTTTTSQTTTTTSSTLYTAGTYQGSGQGFKSTITVSVTTSDSKITNIALVYHNDTPSYWNKAWPIIADRIVSAQSTAVDGISGATWSSAGIKAAVSDALNKARN